MRLATLSTARGLRLHVKGRSGYVDVADATGNPALATLHGLLTTGRTVADAFYQMYYLEQACRLQVAATQGGQKVVLPQDSVAEHAAQQFESFESRGQRPWAALKRRLDRESPDYAT